MHSIPNSSSISRNVANLKPSELFLTQQYENKGHTTNDNNTDDGNSNYYKVRESVPERIIRMIKKGSFEDSINSVNFKITQECLLFVNEDIGDCFIYIIDQHVLVFDVGYSQPSNKDNFHLLEILARIYFQLKYHAKLHFFISSFSSPERYFNLFSLVSASIDLDMNHHYGGNVANVSFNKYVRSFLQFIKIGLLCVHGEYKEKYIRSSNGIRIPINPLKEQSIATNINISHAGTTLRYKESEKSVLYFLQLSKSRMIELRTNNKILFCLAGENTEILIESWFERNGVFFFQVPFYGMENKKVLKIIREKKIKNLFITKSDGIFQKNDDHINTFLFFLLLNQDFDRNEDIIYIYTNYRKKELCEKITESADSMGLDLNKIDYTKIIEIKWCEIINFSLNKVST